MIDLQRDLDIAEAMAADLKAYLLGDALYGSLSEHGPANYPFPMGTLGGLLLRLHRLQTPGLRLTADQRARLAAIRSRLDEQIRQWPVQAEQKAVREIKARLQTWAAYLEEASNEPARYDPEYPTQVEGRVMIHLLLDFAWRAAGGQGFAARLNALDRQLRDMAAGSAFVWDEALIPAFPRETYWWLYVRPRLPHTG